MDQDHRFSLRDLELIAKGNIPAQISLAWLFANDNATRLKIVRSAINFVISSMSKTPQHYHELGEDLLTVIIIGQLIMTGIHATHDTQYGGHCDIVIEEGDFLWIGESKIHSSYEKIMKGFNQLTTRYTTGLPGQDSGDLIVFINQARTDKVMTEWISRLTTARKDVLVEDPTDPDDKITFKISKHPHNRTGNAFIIRHIPLSIHFDPQDK